MNRLVAKVGLKLVAWRRCGAHDMEDYMLVPVIIKALSSPAM